jgi:peroxiredoxin
MSEEIALGKVAPDFVLPDFNGRDIRLSEYKSKKHVVLAFLRGFRWPYCRAHLARLRDEYEAFTARDAEILAIGPDGQTLFQRYWEVEKLPFIGLPDPKHSVADLYNQQVKLIKLGRMPALLVVDKNGIIQYEHYGDSMQDIPENKEILDLLDQLNGMKEIS